MLLHLFEQGKGSAWLRIVPLAWAVSLWGQSLPPTEVTTLLRAKCAGCHGAENPAGGIRLDGTVSIAEPPKLLERTTTTDRALRMPPTGTGLTPEEIAVLRSWPATSHAKVDFNTDVAPILKAACTGCHGSNSPKAQLRLDVAAGIAKGGLGGPVVVAGQAGASRLMHRIQGQGNERRMPLGGAPLTPQQIATIQAWINQGAKLPEETHLSQNSLTETHWAYKRPTKLAGPANASAAIDHFVRARLEKEGLTFSPKANKATLARRVSLDLTGLPPEPELLRTFLEDQSADAYPKFVDQLLASPHFGERWARHWLDLARYADSNGFEKDNRRTMWKYRDWVIDALNKDMPFDQFTIEQLAGDLLPQATAAQKVATGFHRNTMWNEEGGVDKDEVQFEILVDRVGTTATVWMGSTVACSQCHNHKYDPFLQKEYYQLMAFFSNGQKKEVPHGGTTKYEEPILDLASPEQEAKRATLQARVKEIEATLKQTTPALAQAQREWEQQILGASKSWLPLQALTTSGETKLVPQENGALLAQGENPAKATYEITGQSPVTKLQGLRIEALPHASLPRGGPGRDVYGNFLLTKATLEIQRDGRWEPVPFKRIVADDGRTSDGLGVQEKGKPMWVVDATEEVKRLARQLVLVPTKPLSLPRDAKLRIRLEHSGEFPGLSLGHFRITVTDSNNPTLIVKAKAKIRKTLEQPEAERSADDAKKLAEAYRLVAPSLDPLREEMKELKNAITRLGIPTALVVAEASGQEQLFDFVRTRGAFASKAEKVYADVPAVLGSLAPGDPRNRLGLARWLVSRDNPLTARVMVNRLWEQYFGRGIVETSEDFGSQGAAPTHPELLDWLAVDLMDNKWSAKAIHRAIVLSQAYQQESKTTQQHLAKDPYNRLISRGPRFRLEAEMIRDAALVSSGLLSHKVGGPSVFPPQPPNVWDIPYSDEKWEESKGEDRYRRALYTFARRSSMYPAMMNFDATSREFCTVRRIRTNTPLQALTTLNDTAFFEMAQAMAARLFREAGRNEKQRVARAFQLTLGRDPNPNEVDKTLSWLATEKRYFSSHQPEAKRLAPAGQDAVDGAAMTMLSNVLLNLDEALTKE